MRTESLLENLANCRRCSRLVEYLADLPAAKGRCRTEYWNRPVAGFGDLRARVLLIGLAPGAHGANRTGRPFTGDGAGDFMYPLLHQTGFASCPLAVHQQDKLVLHDLFISNAVKCAPPKNRPLAREFACCRAYLAAELERLENLRVVITLGRGAFDSYLRLCREQGTISRLADFPFAHGAAFHMPDDRWLMACYHTSRYNVQTRRMTTAMFVDLMDRARELAAGENH